MSVSEPRLVVGVEQGRTPEPGRGVQGRQLLSSVVRLSQKSALRGSGRVRGEQVTKEEAAPIVWEQGMREMVREGRLDARAPHTTHPPWA